MEFGISTRFFANERLTVDVLERFRKAGFVRIEIFGNRPHFDFHDRSTVRSIARWFDENEAPPPVIHLPFEEPYSRDRPIDLPLFAPEERLRYAAIDELKRCMEVIEFTPIAYAVMHLGHSGQAFNPVLFEHAYAAVAAVQKVSGVKVLIENGLNEASTIEHIREFISVSQLQNVGVCYDTGHAYLRKPLSDFTGIDAIQLNDNDGGSDAHLWPFSGRIDWHTFVDRLISTEYKGAVVFEAQSGKLDTGREVVDRFNELLYQAENSIEEYRLRYKVKTSRNPENEEMG